MLDATARKWIDAPLNSVGRTIARQGIRANWVTLFGLALGLLAALAISFGQFSVALALIVLNRITDGLDGAVARASHGTDLGGFLDIVADFIFYGAVPLAFAIYAPQQNALPATALLFSFYLTGASFLAFAILAAKRGLTTEHQGKKAFYYLGGLAEGTETIAVFLLFCLLPSWFPIIAFSFAGVCLLSAIIRIAETTRVAGD